MKVFLDTNIWLRFLTPEDTVTHSECVQIIQKAKDGQILPYISGVVIAEIIFTLTRSYKFPRSRIIQKLPILLSLRNLTIIEKTATLQALKLYRKYPVSFGDCLIAPQIPPDVILCTYDRDFKKIASLIVKTPAQILHG